LPQLLAARRDGDRHDGWAGCPSGTAEGRVDLYGLGPGDAAGAPQRHRVHLELVCVAHWSSALLQFLGVHDWQGETLWRIRRPHLHSLWKAVEPHDGPVIAAHVLGETAGSWRHDVEELRSPAGCVQYVASHHLKESQAPPMSWGPTRRVRPRKGYWSRPAQELREEAKAIVGEQRIRTRIWAMVDRMEEASGSDLTGLGADLVDEAPSGPPPEVVKVREVVGRMMEVAGPIR
jgi:hypothetical protein